MCGGIVERIGVAKRERERERQDLEGVLKGCEQLGLGQRMDLYSEVVLRLWNWNWFLHAVSSGRVFEDRVQRISHS